jgi:undecaprenyl-phosphate 4-deoxy-4-formamido-L-arabinose transferase
MRAEMEKLSFVIPCYRSEHMIAAVVGEIQETLKTRPEYPYEIILVSDASPDGVFQVIKSLAETDARSIGAELAKNFGQHAALMAGYRMTSGDIIISLDDDGQTPAKEVFSLIDALSEDYDVVYGVYRQTKQNAFRILGSKLNSFMAEHMLGKPKGLHPTSFYVCRRFVMDEMLRYDNAYPYLGGLIFRTTNRIGSVEVSHRTRLEGKSNYKLRKLLSLWMNGFTSFSVKPLRIATVLGLLCALAGFAVMLFTIIKKWISPDVPAGYSSTMAVLLFIGGIIMIILGLIGEYVGRIYIILNNSPQYVIRQVVRQADHVGCRKTKGNTGFSGLRGQTTDAGIGHHAGGTATNAGAERYAGARTMDEDIERYAGGPE